MNVFTSPSTVYDEVAVTPVQTTSWLLPLLFSVILVFVATYAVYNNPALRQQIWDMQEMAMKKAVEEGKMTQDQMETRLNQMENSGPTMFMVFGGGIGSFGVAFGFFGAALVLWLLVKFAFKASASYSKALEVFGLGAMIGIVGGIATLVTMNLMNSMYATPGPALAMGDSFDPMNKMHKMLSAVNIFSIWQVAVVGIGISKISGKSIGTGIGLTIVLWVLWVVVSTMLGLGR
jgi:hypothetical protein